MVGQGPIDAPEVAPVYAARFALNTPFDVGRNEKLVVAGLPLYDLAEALGTSSP